MDGQTVFFPIAYLVAITHAYQKGKEKKEPKYNYVIEWVGG